MTLGTVPAASAQYCTAGSGSCSLAGLDERISRVVLNTLDSTSDPNVSPPGCYTDHTALSTTLQRGSQHPITIEYVNSFSVDGGAAWVDWNHDQDFTDPGEQFILTRTPNLFSGTIVVPANATLGSTRMRVRVTYNGTVPPCGNPSQNYGEVQDFSVNVILATTGACCTAGSGECNIVVAGTCSGTYQGDGSSCSPTNPCGGACCSGFICTTSLAAQCPSGSVFINGHVCGPTSCFYCDAGVSFCGGTDNEIITRVTFANIDNVSDPDFGQPCYVDYTAVSSDVVRGATYGFTFEYVNPTALDQGTVWFDWNRDFVFGDVASGEQVPLTHPGGLANVFAANVTVPAGASIGTTRMRVRVQYTSAPLSCGNNSYGEVEDYTLSVGVPTTGACCAASGSCSITLPGGCAGGAFQGLATSCSPSNPCGGACCNNATGACSVTIAAACPGGSTFINHRVCSATACTVACCDSIGACTVVATAAECVGGTPSVAGTSCSPSPCPGQSCSAPITVALNTPVPGALSNSVSNSTISCSVGVKGIWYKFTAATAGDYAFTSTTTSGTGTPSLALFSACGAELACANPFTVSATITQTMTAGQVIIFREGAANDVEHSYDVLVSPVVNGACCSPTSGVCSTTVRGAIGCIAGTNYMGNNSVCSATLCGQGACCHPPSGACSLGTAAGCPSGWQFQTAGTSCTPNICPIAPQTNYECENAIALTLNVARQGNSAGDPGDGTEFPGGSCFYLAPTNFNHTVWFTFTPAISTEYLISFCGSTYDTAMTVYLPSASPACANLAGGELACDEDTCTGGTSDNPAPGPGPGSIYASTIASISLTAGTTYYLPLACHNSPSFPGFGGPYGVVVRYAATVTLGSCCVGTVCSTTEPFDCTGTFTTGGACNPNPCAPPTGTCCRGATCSTDAGLQTQAACAASIPGGATAGGKFVASAACGGANHTSPCCYADYNKDGTRSVSDIFNFLIDWFGGRPWAVTGGNGTGSPAVSHIFAFLTDWFAGC